MQSRRQQRCAPCLAPTPCCAVTATTELPTSAPTTSWPANAAAPPPWPICVVSARHWRLHRQRGARSAFVRLVNGGATACLHRHIERASVVLEMDAATLRNLEIVQTLSGTTEATLLSLLDRCETAASSAPAGAPVPSHHATLLSPRPGTPQSRHWRARPVCAFPPRWAGRPRGLLRHRTTSPAASPWPACASATRWSGATLATLPALAAPGGLSTIPLLLLQVRRCACRSQPETGMPCSRVPSSRTNRYSRCATAV